MSNSLSKLFNEFMQTFNLGSQVTIDHTYKYRGTCIGGQTNFKACLDRASYRWKESCGLIDSVPGLYIESLRRLRQFRNGLDRISIILRMLLYSSVNISLKTSLFVLLSISLFSSITLYMSLYLYLSSFTLSYSFFYLFVLFTSPIDSSILYTFSLFFRTFSLISYTFFLDFIQFLF